MKLVGILYLSALLALGVGGGLAGVIDSRLNAVEPADAGVGERASALHDTLMVADLHSDILLWDRDPRRRNATGQSDLARLVEGGVELQVFSTVTATPRGQNFDANTLEAGDNITPLAIAQGWPVGTWSSIHERAMHQAEKLVGLERARFLTIVREAGDLDAEGLKGILLSEGAHPLEDDLANVQALFDVGYRVMGLQHFFDNQLGGSMHGESGKGLSSFGRDAVAELDRVGFVLDLAHSSEAVVDDVLTLSRERRLSRPLMVSHTGLRKACPATFNRNMRDDQLKAIADAGGLVGIGFFQGAICDTSPAGIARTIRIAVEELGEDAVALGSDFDGAVVTQITAAELPQLTQALLDEGLTEPVIRKVMGENAKRFFRAHLPK